MGAEFADVRIALNDLELRSGACPAARSAKVDTRQPWPDKGIPRSRTFTEFALGPLMQALNRVEFQGLPRQEVHAEIERASGTNRLYGTPVHSGLIEWTAEAFRNYLRAWDEHQEQVEPRCPIPVEASWRGRYERVLGAGRVQVWTGELWGRRYRSEDGGVREGWLLSFSTPKPRTPAQTTWAVHVAARGRPVGRVRSRVDAFPPRQVRLLAFGGARDRAESLGEWDAREVDLLLAQHVEPMLPGVGEATRTVPGSDCATCKHLVGCGSVTRLDVLPDLPATQSRPRAISPTDLRNHRACPKKYHLTRQLHLRDPAQDESMEIGIGRAVDAWLNDRHRAPRAPRCLPGDARADQFGGLSAEQTDTAIRMLDQHTALCPMSAEGAPKTEVQRQVSAYDDRLRVALVATPDLLYQERGRWVWRETKTSKRPLPPGVSLLEHHPQLAMGVLLLAAGAVDERSPGGRVELEHLQVDTCALEELDAGRPEVVGEARDVMAGLIGPLLADTRFEPAPGRECARCEVRRWCAEGRAWVREVSTTSPAPDDRERE